MCPCSPWFRFISTREGKLIGTVSCPCPKSYRTVRGGRACFPARGWSCSLCCASKPVTMWPLSSTAARTPPGSSSTAWLTVTVGVRAFRRCVLCDIKLILETKLWCTANTWSSFDKEFQGTKCEQDSVQHIQEVKSFPMCNLCYFYDIKHNCLDSQRLLEIDG